MKYRILIVEDQNEMAQTWKKALELEGYEAEVACDGLQGWELWKESPYDVVVLDLKMPRMSGGELLEKIHSRQPSAPVIIISGEGTEEDKLRAVNQHAFVYMEKKDFTIEKMLNEIVRALEARDLLIQALEVMVEKSNNPDQPIIAIGRALYSPRQLFDAARMGTDVGREYLADLSKTVLEMGADRGADQDVQARNSVIE